MDISVLPKATLMVIGLMWIYSFFSIAKWETNEVIQQDVVSYYSYLPAVIIYHDLSFEFADEVIDGKEIKIWYHEAPNGRRVQKMTMGLSLFYLPSFLVAHAYATLFDEEPNGYSWPYELMISLGGLLFGLLGLFYLGKVLLIFFSPLVTAISMGVIAMGTNLFHYAVVEGCMSHVYSFCLFTAFIHYFLIWNESGTKKNSLVLGLLYGLIILVRPSNGIIILLPLLYGVLGVDSMRLRLKMLWERKNVIILAGLLSLLVLSPQLIYWKMITGSWLYYSYPTESFYFSNPHVLEGLMGFRKGWLIYTPVMALSLIGISMLRGSLGKFTTPILVFFALNCYIIFSWWYE